MPPGLHVKLLGSFSLVYGVTRVTTISTPRLQSLLAHLVLHADTPQSRQHLSYLFWPNSTEAQARTNLRRELHNLRHSLPEADRFLTIDASMVQWRQESAYTLDVREFEAALSAARRAEESGDRETLREALQRAVSLYQGDLLPDCYDEWIGAERDRLQGLHVRALEWLVSVLEEQLDYAAAARYAARLLNHDPLHEAACRDLMRLYALAGKRTAGLRAYRAFAARLRREFDIEPEPATRELYEQLLSADLPGTASALTRSTTPMVGRVMEWRQLVTAWRVSAQGRSQLVLIEGEAGIGKTRLAEELRVWASRQGVATAAARSYAAAGEHVYAPVVEWLRSGALRAALARLNPVWLSEISRLLPEILIDRPDIPRPEYGAEGSERGRLFEALARAVQAVGRPLLLLIDDLQWTDRETIAWLHYLLHREPRMSLLVVGTVRPEEVSAHHPLASLRLDLSKAEQLTRIPLGPLGRRETMTLASEVAGRALDEDVASGIYRETEGNPLFIVELVRAALPQAGGQTVSGAGDLRQLPAKVSAVVSARLSHLSAPARDLAGLAATIGRAFSLDVLIEASASDEDTVVTALDELCTRHIVRERGGEVYDFSHDKLREVAYAEISAARRQLLHRRVAHALESIHAYKLEPVSAQLAAHSKEGGLLENAIRYYEMAAEHALLLSAYQDGMDHIGQALELLSRLPPSQERARQEARLHAALGVALMATKGWPTPEVGEVYGRVRTLYQDVGDADELSRLYWGLWGFHIVRGELSTARELGEQELSRAEAGADRPLLIVPHIHLGASLYHLGALASARMHLEEAIALYDPEQHRSHAHRFGPDLGVFSRCYLSHVLWHLGYPDQASQTSQESVAIAHDLRHPYSMAIALAYAAMLSQFRLDASVARAQAEETIVLCRAHEFAYYLAWGTILRGWALSSEGHRDEGLAEMLQGFDALRATGAGLRQTYYLALLAQAQIDTGRRDEGLASLDEAWRCLRRSEERYWEPELHRLRAQALGQGDSGAREAEAHLHRAISVARSQGAKSLELRATMSLSRLWRDQGRREEAAELLAVAYRPFTEGFQTPDLMEAAALLRQLGS